VFEFVRPIAEVGVCSGKTWVACLTQVIEQTGFARCAPTLKPHCAQWPQHSSAALGATLSGKVLGRQLHEQGVI
jgi:hypothetical protein